MCGILGVCFSDPTREASPTSLEAVQDTMRHRGPDDSGVYVAPGVALVSRRLAILDLSPRGHMPMSSPDGRYWIVYNGEVYNFRELREYLEGRGYQFRSDTDTEVLLLLYASEGPAMLDRLNGMFAFAIWDTQERTLFLARDRLGVKPLFLAQRDGALFFASEINSLLAAGISPEFDPATWEELLCFRFVAGERTPYAGIQRLLPGHYLLWKSGRAEIRRWWNLASHVERNRDELPQDPVAWYGETFDSSVALRRISDVPIGVLLSGGLDSSSVAASLAAHAGSGVATFTVRFADSGYDEGPLAKELAQQWKLDYHELEVSDNELLDRIRRASWFHGEPLAHGNDFHIWAISEYAKQRVTVLLSGEGADETLGGYVRYRPLRHPMLLRAAQPLLPAIAARARLPSRVAKLARFLRLGASDRLVLFNSCDALPYELDELGMRFTSEFPYREQVLDEARAVYPGDLFRQAMYNDQHTFLCSLLDRNDRMTMAASIECRVPFLDYRLVERVASLPTAVLTAGKQSKSLLRKSASKRLPQAILSHRKWGFAVPWGRYFRQVPELREFLQELPSMSPVREGPFNPKRLRVLIDRYLAGDDGHGMLLRQIAMVAIWHQECIACGRYRYDRSLSPVGVP